MQVLTQRMEALERRLAEKMLVDFVRPEKEKAEKPVEPEPKLAVEISARAAAFPLSNRVANGATTIGQLDNLEAITVQFDALKPSTKIALSRMNRFTQKVSENVA